ncbi:MAG: M23 family metallopeptidase, partial [Pseudomonadota bacterium]
APTGTPVYAAGRGVLEEAGRRSGFGNYVRIRHNNDVETAYGHLSRFAKGVHRGMRVDQGDIIAYVGSTGSSTGPHLHYEIIQNGSPVNPSGVKFRTGQTLAGRDMAEFKKILQKVKTALATLPRKNQVALARN